MGEDLRKCNKAFEELLKGVKKKVKIDDEIHSMLYFFFISGYNLNSGNTQMVI